MTGCSIHGLGYALVLAFHATGDFRVFATVRNASRMAGLKLKAKSGGEVKTLRLDVLDQPSIERCVAEVKALIQEGESQGWNRAGLTRLVNNAAVGELLLALGLALFTFFCLPGCFPLSVHYPILLDQETETKLRNDMERNGTKWNKEDGCALSSTNMFHWNGDLIVMPYGT